MRQMSEAMLEHLENKLIPFWRGMRDDEKGGYYGQRDYSLELDEDAHKGAVYISRILWFFSNCYMLLGNDELLDDAEHAYEFIRDIMIDKENGGIYWSVMRDGGMCDISKHTYAQAFAVYALASYAKATGEKEPLELAMELFDTIESKCRDGERYHEALTDAFVPVVNIRLSENGVISKYTMNTVLHLAEAYAELFEVSGEERVRARLVWLLEEYTGKLYNSEKRSLNVFFDENMNPMGNIRSYGHEIEASWLMDLAGVTVSSCDSTNAYVPLFDKCHEISVALAEEVYEKAIDGSGAFICDAVDDSAEADHTWWAQAEAVLGFSNAYLSTLDIKYLHAAYGVWDYIQDCFIDRREGGEWFNGVSPDGIPTEGCIAGEWKCPYHNGRMCIKIIEWQQACEILERCGGSDNDLTITVGDEADCEE